MTEEEAINLPVWLYWEGERSDWIRACQGTVLTHASNVQIVTPADLEALCDFDRDIDISNLNVAHRADFIRAFLLYKFGGIWIDSDCVVMQSLLPVSRLLMMYDFIGYKERQGYVSNNFMGAQSGSKIAALYYHRICHILRSEQPLEWLTLGSYALTETIRQAGVAWYEMDVELIQPVCWSHPETFFITRAAAEHEREYNQRSYCYMLSANMVRGFLEENSTRNLLEEDTFFSFLLKKSFDQPLSAKFMNIEYRKNTDDDWWVLPELVECDMYRIKEVFSNLAPSFPNYVVDCGAHIGVFSVMCSLYLRRSEVIAFEPNPESFCYLNKNAKKFGNIRAYNKAVDIKEGTLKLYCPDELAWNGRYTSLPNGNDSITVETIDLFVFIKKLDKPVFILKLDLEGYEEILINKSSKDDLENVKTIIVETHTSNFNHDKLREFGFQLFFQPGISTDRQYVYMKS